jgi:hypothetical protein
MTSAPENQPVGSASRRAGAWGGMGADGFQPPGAAQTLPMPAAAWPTDSDPASSTGLRSPRSRKPQIMPGRIGPGERG